MTIRLRWNPFAVVDHNEWRLPRILFHLAHVAIGLPGLALGMLLHVSPIGLAISAVVLACLDKCVWIDWHQTSGQLLHWIGFHPDDAADFVSDMGLTILGTFAGLLWLTPMSAAGWIISLYLLSTFNGT